MTKKNQQEKQPARKNDDHKELIADYANRWNIELQCCEMANEILQLLTKQQLPVGYSRYILEKALSTIDDSIHLANWGEPLVCGQAIDTAWLWKYIPDIYHEEVREEINRLRSQCQGGS